MVISITANVLQLLI